MVEVFDAHEVSFVSVTQQFNTTTSMGRLTLNVLLSFAQFEREVTAERIRDKIAASKLKGLWMAGVVPLGYRASGRSLVIEPVEAELVRRVFMVDCNDIWASTSYHRSRLQYQPPSSFAVVEMRRAWSWAMPSNQSLTRD